jgi:hypothetical protein
VTLRVSFDLDGVFADFAAAFRRVELSLFGADAAAEPDAPEQEQLRQDTRAPRPPDRRDAIWREIERTPDFWANVAPLDPGAIARLQQLAIRHRWDVFFITQRPATTGDSVQRQTQRWLAAHGFEFPSVIVLHGARGAAIRALQIDYHVDDSAQNCLDVIADSTAKTILVSRGEHETVRKLGIAPAGGVAEALDILERATEARSNPSMLERLSVMLGWRT